MTIPVSVKDYHDIKVDVTWLDSNGAAVNGAVEGTDDVDLKITVDLESSNFNEYQRNQDGYHSK